MTDPRAIIAAQNNADWYAMMCDIHVLRYQRSDVGFCAVDAPPPYHSWATITAPGAQVDALFTPYRDHPHFGLKDGFNQRDWSDYGLVSMFEASWLWAEPNFDLGTDGWEDIRTPSTLEAWEDAWREGSPTDKIQFPAAILDRPDVRIWGRRLGGRFDAGVIANLSNDCVGLSNCFGNDARAAAATLCAGFGQGRPVVGYERDDDLTEALALGFQATGPLTVWIKSR